MGWSNSSSSSTEKYPSLLLLCFPSAIPLIVQLLLRQIHHIQSCYLLICINALQNLIIEMRPHSANLRALTNEEEHKNYCHKITNDSAVYYTLFIHKMFLFSYPLVETCVLGPQKNRLMETVLLIPKPYVFVEK